MGRAACRRDGAIAATFEDAVTRRAEVHRADLGAGQPRGNTGKAKSYGTGRRPTWVRHAGRCTRSDSCGAPPRQVACHQSTAVAPLVAVPHRSCASANPLSHWPAVCRTSVAPIPLQLVITAASARKKGRERQGTARQINPVDRAPCGCQRSSGSAATGSTGTTRLARLSNVMPRTQHVPSASPSADGGPILGRPAKAACCWFLLNLHDRA
jgi:hypothetical protein